MMCLSRTTGYAIQALGCMDKTAVATHRIAAIAKCAQVPRPYLAKIIGALSRRGLVVAKRGLHGGISLARPARNISLLEIVEAVEGREWIGQCLLGFEDCAQHAYCPTQEFWIQMRRELIAKLDQISLAEVLDAKDAKAAKTRKQRPVPAAVFAGSRWPAQASAIPMQA